MLAIKIIISVCTVFPQYSKAETKDDCVHGETYWSEKGIHGKGACVGCVSLATCGEQQIGDKERCVDSCHSPKPKPSKLVPSPSLSVKIHSSTPALDIASLNPTPPAQLHTNTDQAASPTSTSNKAASSTPNLYVGTPRVQHPSSSVAVVNSSTEVEVDKKRRDEKEGNDKTWIIWMCTVLGVAVVVAGIVAVVWWSRRQGKSSAGVDVARVEGIPLPFQETGTALGTQHTGEQDTNLSYLNLSPEFT